MAFTVYKSSYILCRLFKDYLRGHLKNIILTMICMLITAVCTFLSIQLVEPTINKILGENEKDFFILPSIIMSLYVIKGICEFLQSYLIKTTGQRMLINLKLQLYKHLLYFNLSPDEKMPAAKISSRFTSDIMLMRSSLTNLLTAVAKHTSSVILLSILMFKLEPNLSWIILVAFIAAIIPVHYIGKRIHDIAVRIQYILTSYIQRLDTTLNSISKIKANATEEEEYHQIKLLSEELYLNYQKSISLESLIHPIMESLSGISIALILWYGGIQIMKGFSTPGALVAFIAAFMSVYRPFKSLLALNSDLQQGIAATRRIFELLDAKDINHLLSIE